MELQIAPRAAHAASAETPEQKKSRRLRDRARAQERKGIECTAERHAVLDFALELDKLAAGAPDLITRREIHQVVSRLRLRHCATEEDRRNAIFLLLDKWEALTLREIARETGMSEADAREALDYLTGPAVDLVEIFDRGGRQNSGRNGTLLCYRMRHPKP